MNAPCEATDIEHLDATQVIIACRQAATLASMCDAEQRERWAKRFEVLIDELRVGTICMRKERAVRLTIDTPEFLKPDGPPLPERVYLRVARDCLYHE